MFKSLVGAGMAVAMLMASSAIGAEEEECPQKGGDKKHMHGDKMARHGERLAKALELTDEQQEKLKALRERHREETKPLRREMRDAMTELKRLLEDDAKDSKIEAQLDALKAAKKKIHAAMESHQADMAKLLSPKQQAKLVLMMGRKMKDRMHGGKPEGSKRESRR